MTQTARSRLLSASILLLATASLFSYVSLHSHSSAQTPGHDQAKMAHMEWRDQVDAPYWPVEDGFVSTIQMKNYRVDKTVTVTPILFPLHGAEISWTR
jgi:hypothetical protein